MKTYFMSLTGFDKDGREVYSGWRLFFVGEDEDDIKKIFNNKLREVKKEWSDVASFVVNAFNRVE